MAHSGATPHRQSTDANRLLRAAGLRRTPVRAGVIGLLGAATDPLGVPEMLEQLPRDTDAVTVYRTLNTFTRKKLVHRVRGEDRAWRYALSVDVGARSRAPKHRHPHFVCEGCGSVRCLEAARVPERLVRSLSVGSEYAVSYAEVVLHGTCPKCR